MQESLQGDWWLLVRDDLESLDLNLSLHEIKFMSKDKLKKLVHNAVKAQALSWLLLRKSKSEKVKSVPYGKCKMQNAKMSGASSSMN